MNSMKCKKATVENGNYLFFDIDSKYENCKVDEIIYHQARGEGDKHFVDITKNNETKRYFNLIELTFLEERK